MNKVPTLIILDWIKNKKRIQDRINRLNKRLKKYQKQKTHYEFRLECIRRYESRTNK